MRKFLLTFVVLVAGAMSAWAQVAKIGDVPYATLAEAVNAAQNGETITMQQDVTLDGKLVIAAGKTITLDLNGKTISMVDGRTTAGSCEMIINNGNLTIQSSVEGGKLSYTYSGANLGTTYYANTVTAKPGSVLTVKSGTIENLTYDQAVIAYAIDGQTNGGAGDVTVNIEGGVITSKRQAVRIFANSTTNTGTLNISGGEITGRVIVQNANAKANKAALAVTGGTFNPNDYKADVLYVGGTNSATIAIDAAVSGGTFNGAITETAVEGFISGGTFSAAAVASIQGTNLLAEGAELGEPGADGSCTVVSPSDILEINSLEDFLAFRVAVNGGNSFEGMTVRLNTDIDLRELDWSESIGKDCDHPFKGVFDGNNMTINYLITSSNVFASSRNYTGLFGVISGNAVIKDLVLENVSITLDCEGQYVGAVVAYANTEAGIIENVKVLVGGEIPFLKVGASAVEGVGSIVGYAAQSALLKITGCEVKGKEGKIGTITGAEYVGGLIGYASSGVEIENNFVGYLKVDGTSSVGAIAGKILTGAEVVDNTIINVQVSASAEASTAAVVAGTFEDGVIISGTDIQGEVKVNGTSVNSNVLGTAVKVGDVYYTTLEAAYNDESSDVTSIELLGKHNLSEAVSYTQNKDVVVNGDLTYTRNLTTHWNPLYLPFEYEFDAAKYDVAEFTSADGTTLTLTHVEGINVLEANRAYVIRPKSEAARTLEIELDTKTLKAATTNIIDLHNGYSVKGNNIMYTGAEFRTKFGDNSLVVGTNGNWGKLKVTETSVLKPFRLILTIPSGTQAVSMRFVKGTTVVEEVELDMQQAEAIFDLSGRRVETMTEGGVYIVNGKKVIF